MPYRVEHYRVSFFKYNLCKKALAQVFNTIRFDDVKMREILHDSYLANLNAMIQYAKENDMDELAYILSIRNILGGSKYTHER